MVERGTRWQRSVLTFGLGGRLAWTAGLVLVLLWLVFVAGIFGWAAAVIWLGWIMPRALRDLWRPAALPSTDLTRLRDATRRDAASRSRERLDHPTFSEDHPTPRRW